MGSAAATTLGGLAGGGSSAIGNFVGDISGSNAAARAASRAAMDQASMARQMRADILQQSATNSANAFEYASATPQELGILSNALSSQQLQLGREERLLNAIDPALMEASQQALKLLRGETSAATGPMNALRASQRQQLVDSLRSQYGPGAETSSIGQRALNEFDLQTGGQQMNALNQVFGIASADLGGRAQRGISGLQQIGQGYSALNERRLNAVQNSGNATLGALAGTQQQMIQGAGAPYVGDALRAQSQQALFNQAVGIGGMAFGNYMGGLGMGKGMASGMGGAGGGGYNGATMAGGSYFPTGNVG